MDSQLEGVIRRINKLLAIAGDTRANPNEAMAAANQAEKLMRKYQLDNADIVMKEIKNDPASMATADARADAITNGNKAKTVPPWASWLAAGVADLVEVGVTTCTNAKFGAAIRFYGYKHDVELAVWLMDYFVATINKLAFQYRSSAEYEDKGRSVMTDYRKGVVIGLRTQIRKAIQEREAEMAQSSAGRSLVIVKADAIVARFGGNVVARKKANTSNYRHENSLSAGIEAGRKIDINRRGIGNDSKSTPSLGYGG